MSSALIFTANMDIHLSRLSNFRQKWPAHHLRVAPCLPHKPQVQWDPLLRAPRHLHPPTALTRARRPWTPTWAAPHRTVYPPTTPVWFPCPHPRCPGQATTQDHPQTPIYHPNRTRISSRIHTPANPECPRNLTCRSRILHIPDSRSLIPLTRDHQRHKHTWGCPLRNTRAPRCRVIPVYNRDPRATRVYLINRTRYRLPVRWVILECKGFRHHTATACLRGNLIHLMECRWGTPLSRDKWVLSFISFFCF